MHHFKRSYEGQCDEVDRLYPALEVRRYLSASLAQAAETPMFLSMSLPMSIIDRPNGIRTQNPRTRFDSEGTWTPQSVDRDLDLEKGQNHDLILDNIDDIFTLSGSSNSSSTSTPAHRPDPNPTGSNEFELDSATSDFDEESLYSDAMSRKASLVRIHECMLSIHTHIKLEFYHSLLFRTEKVCQIIPHGTLNLFLILGTHMDCAQAKILFIAVWSFL